MRRRPYDGGNFSDAVTGDLLPLQHQHTHGNSDGTGSGERKRGRCKQICFFPCRVVAHTCPDRRRSATTRLPSVLILLLGAVACCIVLVQYYRIHILFLRHVLFPLARPTCPLAVHDGTPLGALSSSSQSRMRKIKFGVATVYLPRTRGVAGTSLGSDTSSSILWTSQDLQMYQISESNKRRYARTKGYAYYNGTEWALQNLDTQVVPHLVRNEELGTERAVWIKPLYLSHLLSSSSSSMREQRQQQPQNTSRISNLIDTDNSVEWILYLDTDAIVMDHHFDLTRLLATARVDYDPSSSSSPDEDTTGVIVSTDARGINTGAMLIRNDSRGERIVRAWVRGATEGLARGQNDQDYFRRMFDMGVVTTAGAAASAIRVGVLKDGAENFADGASYSASSPTIRVVPPCALQSLGGLEWDDKRGRPYWEGAHVGGDFIVHFFGRPDKLEQMKIAASGSLTFFS